jgi:hypothetical protein
MKITIEPTAYKGHPTSSISVTGDDLTISELIEKLVVPAILGIGFSQELVRKYIPESDL